VCYLFDSLLANGLLRRGDRIAVAVPIFSPYLEIPNLERYAFDIVRIDASERREDGTQRRGDGSHTWQYPDAEIDKVADPSVKALVLVNPSNPPSVAMRPATLERLARIVRTRRPDLIVITDDVYATFVEGFRSVFAALPRNTVACIRSRSISAAPAGAWASSRSTRTTCSMPRCGGAPPAAATPRCCSIHAS